MSHIRARLGSIMIFLANFVFLIFQGFFWGTRNLSHNITNLHSGCTRLTDVCLLSAAGRSEIQCRPICADHFS
jgi:hypothetical protein